MKLTKARLQQIIKEEIAAVTNEANLDSLKGSEAADARSALDRIGLDPKDVSHEDYVAASAYAGQQLAKYVRDNGMRFSDLGVDKAQSMADDFVREFLGRKG